ncbi:MAG TPA: hypothetical protein VF534_01585 [Paraburkholderia sp.]
MSQFEQLLGELQAENEAMAKALPADDGKDDNKIQAAAGEGGGDGGGANGGGANPDDEEEDDDKGTPMGKSLTLTDAEGNPVEAIDGTELVKSLMEEVGALKGQVGTHETTMAKALEQTLGVVKAQGALIKSLMARVDALSGQGRGRKTVLAVTEKVATGALAKSEPSDGITPQEFLVKSEAAFNAQKISGLEFTTIDVSLRSNVAIDPALVSKVLA